MTISPGSATAIHGTAPRAIAGAARKPAQRAIPAVEAAKVTASCANFPPPDCSSTSAPDRKTPQSRDENHAPEATAAVRSRRVHSKNADAVMSANHRGRVGSSSGQSVVNSQPAPTQTSNRAPAMARAGAPRIKSTNPTTAATAARAGIHCQDLSGAQGVHSKPWYPAANPPAIATAPHQRLLASVPRLGKRIPAHDTMNANALGKSTP